GGSVGRDHDRNDDLTPRGILHADDGDIAYQRVLHKHILDFGGRDVLAAADDGVVGAPGDEQIAIVIERGDILRRKPPVFVEHRTDLGVFPGNLLATDEQLAGLTRAKHRAAVTPDLNLDARYRLAHRAEPSLDRLVGRAVRGAMIVGRQNRDR